MKPLEVGALPHERGVHLFAAVYARSWPVVLIVAVVRLCWMCYAVN